MLAHPQVLTGYQRACTWDSHPQKYLTNLFFDLNTYLSYYFAIILFTLLDHIGVIWVFLLNSLKYAFIYDGPYDNAKSQVNCEKNSHVSLFANVSDAPLSFGCGVCGPSNAIHVTG